MNEHTVNGYLVHTYWSEHGYYIADAPELQYCSAHGDTEAEAIQEIATAIDLWVEMSEDFGHPVPKRRSVLDDHGSGGPETVVVTGARQA